MPNPTLNLAPFSRWTLRDKAAQRRLVYVMRFKMNKRTFLNLSLTVALLVISGSLAAAEDFGAFLQRFFNDRTFQLERVQFPLAKEDLVLGEGVKQMKIQKSEWKHLLGPGHLRCKKDCFDIVVYDNFELKMRDTGKRVLSYEGLGNGIKEAFYFQLLNGKWTLVKWENLSS